VPQRASTPPMVVDSSGSALVSLKQGLEFEPCEWSTPSLRELYFLISLLGSTGLVAVQWTSRY